MGQSKETELQVAAKRKKIWDLRLAGYTAADIAVQMKCSEATVHRHLSRAVELIDVTQYLESEQNVSLSRIEQLIKIYWPAAAGVGKHDGEPNMEVAQFVLKLDESRRKLLGLDAPKRVDVRALIIAWAEREGFDPDDVLDVTAGLLPEPGR